MKIEDLKNFLENVEIVSFVDDKVTKIKSGDLIYVLEEKKQISESGEIPSIFTEKLDLAAKAVEELEKKLPEEIIEEKLEEKLDKGKTIGFTKIGKKKPVKRGVWSNVWEDFEKNICDGEQHHIDEIDYLLGKYYKDSSLNLKQYRHVYKKYAKDRGYHCIMKNRRYTFVLRKKKYSVTNPAITKITVSGEKRTIYKDVWDGFQRFLDGKWHSYKEMTNMINEVRPNHFYTYSACSNHVAWLIHYAERKYNMEKSKDGKETKYRFSPKIVEMRNKIETHSPKFIRKLRLSG